MVDNFVANPGTGGKTFASDDIGGVDYQRVKLILGIDGTNDGDVAQTNPLPIDLREILGVALDVNAGNVSAGTQRVVLASDQAAVTVKQATAANLKMEEASAAGILTSVQLIDDAVHARTAAFSKSMAIGGEMDDTGTIIATEGNVSPIRITAQRGMHINLRNNAGTEIGTSGSPVRTDPTGATNQPVSGTVTEPSAAASLTSLQLIDDAVGTDAAAHGGSQKGMRLLGTDGTNDQQISVESNGHVHIHDGGNSITIDGAVTANPGTGDFLSIAAHTRNEPFKEGNAVGGELDDTATTAATENAISPVRITAQRAFHANLRNNSGTELGTASDPIRVDPTGTTTQPVTANAGTGDFLSIAAHTRNEAFKEGMAIGGELDDTGTTAATENAISPVRITAQRAFHVNLRNNAGTEIGTPGDPVRNDPTGTTTQPVSGVGTFAVDQTDDEARLNGVFREDIDRSDGTTLLVMKFAVVAASASGDNVIVAAVAGKKIRVLSVAMSCAAAVNVQWQDSTPTNLSGVMEFAAKGGYSAEAKNGLFETASNTILHLNLSSAVAVGGHISYVEV